MTANTRAIPRSVTTQPYALTAADTVKATFTATGANLTALTAGQVDIFFKILLPLSRTNVIAMAIILFLWSWNQYLWPLLVTSDKSMATAVIGLRDLGDAQVRMQNRQTLGKIAVEIE